LNPIFTFAPGVFSLSATDWQFFRRAHARFSLRNPAISPGIVQAVDIHVWMIEEYLDELHVFCKLCRQMKRSDSISTGTVGIGSLLKEMGDDYRRIGSNYCVMERCDSVIINVVDVNFARFQNGVDEIRRLCLK
jgi:hypothetical protein